MPQVVYELRHDGGKADAYYAVSTEAKSLCSHSFIGKGQTRPPHIEVTASTTVLSGALVTTTSVLKTGGSWKWRMPKAKFPIIIYPEGQQVLDSFFPSAKEGDEFTVWLKTKILPP